MRNTAAEPEAAEFVHVAVAAIVNAGHEVLVSRRPDHVHQGGLWEFPGGKVEAGESVQDALDRELLEELGITISRQRPLIRIPHRYPDKAVVLDVWLVDAFEGVPYGREGQPLEWVAVEALSRRSFPAANAPIIAALELPTEYLITPEPDAGEKAFLRRLGASLDNGIRLVQLRAKSLDRPAYVSLARQAIALCHAHGASILLNAEPDLAAQLGADGVHLNSERLRQWQERPLPGCFRVAASCHDLAELRMAETIGADFAVLSPVCQTASHPQTAPLGWPVFAKWVDACAMPVYALGGMTGADIRVALQHGAQGIAAISALWKSD